ncbi:MAG: hypothetical protein ACC707_05670 [Thiohalomonadales bacterium]
MNKKLNLFTMVLVGSLVIYAIMHSLQQNSRYYKVSILLDIEVILFILVLVLATLNAGLAIIFVLKKKWQPFKTSLQWLSICLVSLIFAMIIDAPTLLYSE